MRSLLTTLLDSIFPPSNHQQQLRQSTTSPISLYRPHIFKNIICLSSYQEALIQAAVIENKFHHQEQAAKLLGTILQHWVKSKTEELIFVPIPLGPKRLRQRGHNQVDSILNQLNPKSPVELEILYRQHETAPQSQLAKEERVQNMVDAFGCSPSQAHRLAGKHVVLIDDVVTTGATMAAAQSAITAHLPPNTQLTCLALAH